MIITFLTGFVAGLVAAFVWGLWIIKNKYVYTKRGGER